MTSDISPKWHTTEQLTLAALLHDTQIAIERVCLLATTQVAILKATKSTNAELQLQAAFEEIIQTIQLSVT
jgi:hypothetical protein